MTFINTGIYTVRNALLWGSCVAHIEEAKKADRFAHLTIAAIEALPVVGQIVSIAEYIFVTHSIQNYNLQNALLWGNCREHFQQSKSGLTSRRIVHLTLASIQLLPIIGQIASLVELLFSFTKTKTNLVVDSTWDAFKINGTVDDRIDQLSSNNYYVDKYTIKSLFLTLNYEYIFALCSHHKKELVENADLVFDLLMRLENQKLATCVLERVPELKGKVPERIFKLAISLSCGWFVEWVFVNTPPNFDFKTDEFRQLAIRSRNLDIILRVCENFDVLGINEITDKKVLLNRLTEYAIMSPLSAVYTLAKHYPNIATMLPDALKRASVVVRFTSYLHAWEIYYYSSNEHVPFEDFIERTLFYADGNIQFLETLKLKDTTRSDVLQKIVDNRTGRLGKNTQPELYKNKLPKDEEGTQTPLMRKTYTDGAELLRYAASWKHLTEIRFNFNDGKWRTIKHYPQSMSETKDDSIVYQYRHDNSEVVYNTTKLKYDRIWCWTHTQPAVGEELQNHLEELQKEIVDFKLDYTDDLSRKAFFAKIARGYWLISTLCEMARGTPHNSMIWLNSVYNHHHLPSPIPKQEHFFLDNTMLMIPYERAIEQWETFFEPLIDEVLPEESIKILLETNGLLLGQCSPKTRSNELLVKAAIAQNPLASAYASPIASS